MGGKRCNQKTEEADCCSYYRGRNCAGGASSFCDNMADRECADGASGGSDGSGPVGLRQGRQQVFSILVHQFRKNARILLNQEKADKDRLQAALAQIERERAAMENIQAALGSGPWSMEFDERGEIIACIWTDVFRHMLGYEGEADFPNRLDSWSNLLHEEDKAYVMKEYWYTVRDYTGEKTYDVKYRLLTRNAGWR